MKRKSNIIKDTDSNAVNDSKRPRRSCQNLKVEKNNQGNILAKTTKQSNGKLDIKKYKKAGKEHEEECVPSTSSCSRNNVKREKNSASGKKETKPPANNIVTAKSAVERTFLKKGRAAVDALCPVAEKSHVYEEQDDIYDCMLNQTNIQFNNNKYYIIQLLEEDRGGVYYVWMRWGRVGANGQNSLQPCGGSLELAQQIFTKKFQDKTRNNWEERSNFQKVVGKYDLVYIDYSEDVKSEDRTDSAPKKSKRQVVCDLEEQVRQLVELICDINLMEATLVEMKYDADKAPLGKLTKEQIKAGYEALLEISNIISKSSGKSSNNSLLHACNSFYTRIPHYFGMKVPPLIRTTQEVQQKLELLETLGDIQAALSFLKDTGLDTDVHPADRYYKGLQCDIRVLSPDAHAYQIISKYVALNHGKTHSSFSLAVENIFECVKPSETSRFKTSLGNRMLLWHGSRLSNYAGILSQGLRIAPPEAPVTGYMFGKGIYFADMCSKSANYCMASCTNTAGLLVLCEVALGATRDLDVADYDADKLPSGFNSVKGVGSMGPDSKNFVSLEDGIIVPLGPAKRLTNSKSLLYNEYIVYDPAQVRMRYLVKIKFNFDY